MAPSDEEVESGHASETVEESEEVDEQEEVTESSAERVGGGAPSWVHSMKHLFGSVTSIPAIFVPICLVAQALKLSEHLQFWTSIIAIISLSRIIGIASDQLSSKLDRTYSTLLNATFGNAVEIIVGLTALLKNQYSLVQTSMLGSILSNLLFVLGTSCLAGGLKHKEVTFNVTGAQAAVSLLTLSCITLMVPAVYSTTKIFDDPPPKLLMQAYTSSGFASSGAKFPPGEHGLLIISRGTSMLLLLAYAAFLFFQLRTHAHLFKDDKKETASGGHKMNASSALICLILAALGTIACANTLVRSVEATATALNLSIPFIGLIIIPLAGNATEHITAVWAAIQNKMEVAVGICVGSSIQVSTLVTPLLVLVGWITKHDLTLRFGNFESVVLFVSVLLANMLIMDGKSNWMEGLMLLTLYAVVVIAFWAA